jgi:hypothetical protein
MNDVLSVTEDIFGTETQVKKAGAGIAGVLPFGIGERLIDPDVSKAKAKYQTFKKKIVGAFVENDKVPIYEQQLVQNLLPSEESFFQDPADAAMKLNQIRDVIIGYLDKSKEQLGMATKTIPKIKGTGSQIDPFYPKLENDIANYQSGQYFYWNGELRRRK